MISCSLLSRIYGERADFLRAISDSALREVRRALLEADVNFKVAKDFIAQVREKAVGEEVFGSLKPDQTVIKNRP